MNFPIGTTVIGALVSVIANWQPPSGTSDELGANYCDPAVPNSTGVPAVMSASGSSNVADNLLTLTASDLPAGRFGYFLTSQQEGLRPNHSGSLGTLCLSRPMGRFATLIQRSGPSGEISIPVDLTALPMLGAVLPGDTFNFQCWYRDTGGTSNFSDALSIQFDGPVAMPPRSDDFNDFNLDTDVWHYVDPTSSGCITLTGTNTRDALLQFDLPMGVDLVAYTVLDAVQLVQDVTDADFGIEVKFQSVPSEAYQEQGIIIKHDDDNWMRFDFYSRGSGNVYVYSGSVVDDVPTDRVDQLIVVPGSELYLRVTRTGNNWLQEYSFDGNNWVQAANYAHPIAVQQVGLFAANSGSPATAHTVTVDYFRNLDDSLRGEDASVVTDTTAPFQYNVVTSAGSDFATVDWKTDEPASTTLEYGSANGDYGLGSISTPALTTDHSVNIPGLDPLTTYHFRLSNTDGSGFTSVSDDMTVTTN